jgi:truncated hemoglobin YjbI
VSDEQAVYDASGGEDCARLVRAFYAQLSNGDVLGPMHPAHDLAGAEQPDLLKELVPSALLIRIPDGEVLVQNLALAK